MRKPKVSRRAKGAGSIFKKKSSQNWYYKNPTKNISAVSLGTSVYKDAVEVAKEKYGYLELEDEQKQQERLMLNYEATRKHIEENQKAIIPLDLILEEYAEAIKLARRSKGKSPEIKQSTKVIVNNFITWVKRNFDEVESMDKVTVKVAQDYFNSKTCKASSYNRYLVELRVVWDRINQRHMRSFNPFDAVTKIEASTVRKEKASKRPFTPGEFKIISGKATGWIRLAIIIGYYSGLRLSDVITLRNADISNDGFIGVQARKTGKDQLLYCPEMLPALREWRKKAGVTEFVFQNQAETYLGLRSFLPSARSKEQDKTIKPNPTKASKDFQKFLKDTCKFETQNADGATILGFHSLRVSNATYSERIGVSRDKIKENLAHSDMRVTEGYIQRQLDEIKAEMRRTHKSLPALSAADFSNDVAKAKAEIMSIEAIDMDDFKKKLRELLSLQRP